MGLLGAGRGGTAHPAGRRGRGRSPAPACCCWTAAEQRFAFEDVPAAPVPSLLRGFSAPVKLAGVSRERLRFLATHDTDPFVRWESGQHYATAVLLDLVAAARRAARWPWTRGWWRPRRRCWRAPMPTGSSPPRPWRCPSEAFVADQMEVADPDAIHAAREFLRAELGRRLAPALRATYDRLADPGRYRIDGAAIGRRALRNACLPPLPPPAPRASRWPGPSSTPPPT